MADYFTNDEELTAVADAIREKTGGNEPLRYEDGFVGAIRGIQTAQEAINDDVIGVNTTWSSQKINTELGAKIPTSQKGVANGVATLDTQGKLPASQLPAVADDDVFEYASRSNFPEAGVAAKIYVAKDTGFLYTWNGTTYITLVDDSSAATNKVWSASKVSGELTGLEESVDAEIERLDSVKVDKNSTVDELTAGTAEEVLGKYENETGMYTLRRTSELAGNRERLNKIVGGTVAWNQLVLNGDFSDGTTGWSRTNTTMSVSGNVATVTQTAQSGFVSTTVQGYKDHIMLYMMDFKGESGSVFNFNGKFKNITADGQWQSMYSFQKPTKDGSVYTVVNNSSEELQTYYLKNFTVFDLTQMFGSTIADAIYAMEQATPGAGVAWFRNLFPNDYYAYDAGSLQSVNVAAHRLTGKNLFDKDSVATGKSLSPNGTVSDSSWCNVSDFIPVMASTTYYMQHGVGSSSMCVGCAYNSRKEYLSVLEGAGGSDRNGFVNTPENCAYIKLNIHNSHLNDAQIELGSIGTNYEPYNGHTYPMGNVELRGIPSLSDGKLVYDGDEYTPDGSVTRKYGIVDLGTLTWSKSSTITNGFVATGNIPSDFPIAPGSGSVPKWLNSKGYDVVSNKAMNTSGDKRIAWRVSGSTGKGVIVNDSAYATYYTNNDMTSFKTAMSGVYLVYELATPTIETADPYNPVQICDPSGTEQFVDRAYEAGTRDVEIPVQHSTDYFVPVIDYIGESVTAASDRKADVITSTASGAIATFADGADDLPMALTVRIEPVQDLHGYDNPWPAGGGKNKFDQDTAYANIKQSDGSFFGRGYDVIQAQWYIPDSLVGQELTFSAYLKIPSDSTITNLRVEANIGGVEKRGSIVSDSDYTRSTVTFTPTATTDYLRISFGSNGIQNLQFKDVQLEVGSSATAYAPYSNICPITGWTGANVSRTGRNLFGENTLLTAISNHVPVSTISGRTISYQAGALVSSDYPAIVGIYPNKEKVYGYKFKENTQYSIILTGINSTANRTNVRIRYTDGTYTNIGDFGTTKNTLVIVSTNGKTIRDIEKLNGGGTTTIYVDESGIFEGVLTENDFEPYAGATYPITFPSSAGTVYGGTLSINKDGTGELSVDMEYIEVSSSSVASGTSNYVRVRLGNLGYVISDDKQFSNALASYFRTASSIPPGSLKVMNSEAYNQSQIIFCFKGCAGSTVGETCSLNMAKVAELEQAGTPLSVCYTLAEPIRYPLTAPQVRTLLGMNNVWADTGDVTAEYPADTKLYIDKAMSASRNLMELIVTANREDSMKATKAYSTGDLLIVNGTLYKATTNIANGATLTAGTNVTATTVAAELAALA